MTKRDYYKYKHSDLDRAKWFWGFLNYGLILSVIPFLIYSNKNKFIYHHARQGVVQFVFFVASFLFLFIPKVGELLLIVSFMLNFSISIIGLYLYLKKKIFEIPIIGILARLLKVSDFDY